MKSLVILSLLALAAPITCDIFFTLVDPGNLYSNPICPKFSVEDFKKCLAEFDDIQFELMQTRAKCCTLAHLKKCAVDAISDHCGDKNEEMLDMVMKGAIKKIPHHRQCQVYDGNVATILCLPGK